MLSRRHRIRRKKSLGRLIQHLGAVSNNPGEDLFNEHLHRYAVC